MPFNLSKNVLKSLGNSFLQIDLSEQLRQHLDSQLRRLQQETHTAHFSLLTRNPISLTGIMLLTCLPLFFLQSAHAILIFLTTLGVPSNSLFKII
jgi:hypothetical protein